MRRTRFIKRANLKYFNEAFSTTVFLGVFNVVLNTMLLIDNYADRQIQRQQIYVRKYQSDSA